MTKEDIDIQAHLYEDSCHNPSIQRHFTDGALWMKEEIIDKACEWLNANKVRDDIVGYFLDTQREEMRNEFIEEFRKAMED